MNYFDVLVGAIIGLVASLITSFIAHLFETARNNRARKWQIEDRQNAALSELLKERINQIENSVNNLRDLALSVIEAQAHIMVDTKNVSKDDLQKLILADSRISFLSIFSSLRNAGGQGEDLLTEINNKTAKISSATFEAIKTLAPLTSLDSSELIEGFQFFINSISNESKNIKRLASMVIRNQEIDFENESSRIQKFLLDVFTRHGQLIIDLDKKRASLK